MDKYEFDFYIKQLERYLDNSVEAISKSEIEGKYYTDKKYTRTALKKFFFIYE